MINESQAKELCRQGDIYYFSENPDYLAAFNCYKEASTLPYGEAFFKMGNCYEYGKGVELDYPKAIECYSKATSLNNQSAIKKIQEINKLKRNKKQAYEETILTYYRDKNYSKALYWINYLKDCNYILGYNLLGCCYLNGTGVEKDYEKAFELFEYASKKHCAEAHYHLGYCYERGYGVNMDKEKALELYEKSVLAVTTSFHFVAYNITKTFFGLQYVTTHDYSDKNAMSFTDMMVAYYQNKFKSFNEDTIVVDILEKKDDELLGFHAFTGLADAWLKIARNVENDEHAEKYEDILCYFQSAMYGNKEAQEIILDFIRHDPYLNDNVEQKEARKNINEWRKCVDKWMSKYPIRQKIGRILRALKMMEDSDDDDIDDIEIEDGKIVKKNKTTA